MWYSSTFFLKKFLSKYFAETKDWTMNEIQYSWQAGPKALSLWSRRGVGIAELICDILPPLKVSHYLEK